MDEAREASGSGGLLHRELTGEILGAFYAVHRELGFGFLETVYGAALVHELSCRGLVARKEVGCPVSYRGVAVGQFWADVIVNDIVVLELKAARAIDPMHVAQLTNYLRATRHEVGFLLNFGRRAEFARVVSTHQQEERDDTSPPDTEPPRRPP